MFTAVLKAIAVVGLIIALFWRSPNYEALLSFLVCVAALVVVGQAIQLKNYIGIAVFLAICALENADARAPLLRGKRGRQAGAAATHDDDVEGFPLAHDIFSGHLNPSTIRPFR